jgi:hypothetical protein
MNYFEKDYMLCSASGTSIRNPWCFHWKTLTNSWSKPTVSEFSLSLAPPFCDADDKHILQNHFILLRCKNTFTFKVKVVLRGQGSPYLLCSFYDWTYNSLGLDVLSSYLRSIIYTWELCCECEYLSLSQRITRISSRNIVQKSKNSVLFESV